MQLNRETIFEIKDGETLRKALIEAEVVEKKCHLYAEMAKDGHVKGMFENVAKDMGRAVDKLKKMTPRYM